MNVPNLIEIKKSQSGNGLFAKKNIKKNSVIFHFDGIIDTDAHTNPESLQIDDDKFLESNLKFDDFLNHSCDPACYIDWQKLNLISLKDIQMGEELSFNYNTTEYDLINLVENCSFKCKCNSKSCIGEIKGFRYLSFNQKKKIQKYFSPYLKKKFEQEL